MRVDFNIYAFVFLLYFFFLLTELYLKKREIWFSIGLLVHETANIKHKYINMYKMKLGCFRFIAVQ